MARLLDSLAVMAIDDQEEARDALEAVLSASGAQVRLASSGRRRSIGLRATRCAMRVPLFAHLSR
jgi:ATP-binding cassette subfamily B protein